MLFSYNSVLSVNLFVGFSRMSRITNISGKPPGYSGRSPYSPLQPTGAEKPISDTSSPSSSVHLEQGRFVPSSQSNPSTGFCRLPAFQCRTGRCKPARYPHPFRQICDMTRFSPKCRVGQEKTHHLSCRQNAKHEAPEPIRTDQMIRASLSKPLHPIPHHLPDWAMNLNI
jgi:hypothetical protein